MATQRTLIPPRSNDAYSFFGTGRWLYQRTHTRSDGMIVLDDPQPKEGAPVLLRG